MIRRPDLGIRESVGIDVVAKSGETDRSLPQLSCSASLLVMGGIVGDVVDSIESYSTITLRFLS